MTRRWSSQAPDRTSVRVGEGQNSGAPWNCCIERPSNWAAELELEHLSAGVPHHLAKDDKRRNVRVPERQTPERQSAEEHRESWASFATRQSSQAPSPEAAEHQSNQAPGSA